MRPLFGSTTHQTIEFQFTHPGKGATAGSRICPARIAFQFTHPGKGATNSGCSKFELLTVSIHAPWEGCDFFTLNSIIGQLSFNSRTLGRVRRPAKCEPSPRQAVSIHAPWEGCDSLLSLLSVLLRSFNSRTLGRVRRSTVGNYLKMIEVSIHAPWEGCDRGGW